VAVVAIPLVATWLVLNTVILVHDLYHYEYS